MSELSSAERHRRAREWLRVESSDAAFDRELEAAKSAVNVSAADFETLIALGEWKGAHATLATPMEPPSETTSIITHFAYETLGYQPDPEKGRLRLRPDFPRGWHAAVVENLRVGDALVRLSYERNEAAVRFEIAQVTGAMPVRLIFEPVLRDKFERVTIDGQAAELNIAVVGDAVVAPVQLMLDAARVVEFG